MPPDEPEQAAQVAGRGADERFVADDRLLPITRGMGWFILPVLTAAFVILFLFPTRTESLWAWTIAPPVTVTTMGGGYLAGAVFFWHVARARRWHTVGRGFPPITVFTSLLLLATLLHWEQFNHGSLSFWAWLALYVTTPVLLPVVWLRNRRYDPGPGDDADNVVGDTLRFTTAAAGAVLSALAAVAFIDPQIAIDVWPWTLTPLTARTLAAFASFPAVTLLSFAWESRWSALAWPFEATVLGLGLTSVGVLIHLGDLTAGSITRMIYLVVLIGSFVALGAVALRRRPTGASSASEG